MYNAGKSERFDSVHVVTQHAVVVIQTYAVYRRDFKITGFNTSPTFSWKRKRKNEENEKKRSKMIYVEGKDKNQILDHEQHNKLRKEKKRKEKKRKEKKRKNK